MPIFGNWFRKNPEADSKPKKPGTRKSEASTPYSEQLRERRKLVKPGERERLKHMRETSGAWLTNEDRRQAQLMTLRDVDAWLTMTEEARAAWFERVESYLQEKDDNWQRWKESVDPPTSEELADQVEERRLAADLLGVPMNADPSEIRRAFRVASKRHHPDVGGDIRQFTAIQHAYDVMMGR
jgi:hypothetical protein